MPLPSNFQIPAVRSTFSRQKSFTPRSSVYPAMVHKWRYHFYGVIDGALQRLGTPDIPLNFSLMELYMQGWKVRYGDIKSVPADILPVCSIGEVGEGWNLILGKTIYLFYDPDVSPVRQRFTLGHEWGHVFQKLDGNFKMDMETIPDDEERVGVIESVANYFSAYYLVPHSLLEQQMALVNLFELPAQLIPSLAKTFNVSEAVMTYRIPTYTAMLKK